MTNFVEKIDFWISKICKSISIFLLTAMSIITFVEVIRRYAFGYSFAWAEELVRFLLVWLTFIGGSMALRTKNLVFFDLFIERLPVKKKIFINISLNFVVITFISYLLFLSRRFIFQKSILLQKSPGLEIPMVYVYSAIPIGCILLMFFSALDIYQRIEALKE